MLILKVIQRELPLQLSAAQAPACVHAEYHVAAVAEAVFVGEEEQRHRVPVARVESSLRPAEHYGLPQPEVESSRQSRIDSVGKEVAMNRSAGRIGLICEGGCLRR